MKFNLDLPENLHSELKIKAVKEKESMNSLIVKAIEKLVKKDQESLV